MPFDDTVGDWFLGHLGARRATSPLVMEGGGLESNGAGTFLTTESCALNDNRNPGLTREAFERALGELVVADRVIWLRDGLAHDHTDGHVDMIARFAAVDTVLCMRPAEGAPNTVVLGEVVASLRDAELSVLLLPPPPELADAQGVRLPATYCNFYVANDAVIVPTYGVAEDEEALEVIAEAFGGRQVIGLPAHDLLCGGGAFHCVTQPQPAAP
jgi:agmatine deiminase